jgi:uncharacterized surface protein with fasciclin (FAS1) repeats
MTIFVPTDEAFDLVDDKLRSLNEEEITRIVFFHFYEGIMKTYDELECMELLYYQTK